MGWEEWVEAKCKGRKPCEDGLMKETVLNSLLAFNELHMKEF
jgi:hypothetical protein